MQKCANQVTNATEAGSTFYPTEEEKLQYIEKCPAVMHLLAVHDPLPGSGYTRQWMYFNGKNKLDQLVGCHGVGGLQKFDQSTSDKLGQWSTFSVRPSHITLRLPSSL